MLWQVGSRTSQDLRERVLRRRMMANGWSDRALLPSASHMSRSSISTARTGQTRRCRNAVLSRQAGGSACAIQTQVTARTGCNNRELRAGCPDPSGLASTA